MHDIAYFVKIRYANILQLIWLIIDTNNDLCACFFPTPHCRDHQVSSAMEFTYSIIMQLLPCWSAGKCRQKFKAVNDVIFIPSAKEKNT